MSVTKTSFGFLKDGKEAHLFTLENAKGMRAVISDFGAVWVSMFVPDRAGKLTDVVLGYDKLQQYEYNFDMMGATVGRNVNRIAKGRFTLNGKTYQLCINDGENNIHSSMEHGFHKVLWDAEIVSDDSVSLTYFSPDGENGFPGNMEVSQTYTLMENGALMLSYRAKADQRTLLNITNHAYFNLAGSGNGDILDTEVFINADYFSPVDAETIPTGEVRPVEGTAHDFRTYKSIGRDFEKAEEQLLVAHGYDHNFVLKGAGKGVRKAAAARSPRTGIEMLVYTDLPGLQFYSGNNTMDSIGKGGKLITKHSGFCMEAHYCANSINIPYFPQPVVEKNAEYRTTTIYQFL